jgi:hypothetical protein
MCGRGSPTVRSVRPVTEITPMKLQQVSDHCYAVLNERNLV